MKKQRLKVVKDIPPNSPLGLSQASLWRHTKIFLVRCAYMITENIKILPSALVGLCMTILAIIFILFPPCWPIFAWFGRNFWRKEVKKLERN